jgi:hypothetical protein
VLYTEGTSPAPRRAWAEGGEHGGYLIWRRYMFREGGKVKLRENVWIIYFREKRSALSVVTPTFA